MSFRFNKQTITLDNYISIFRGLSPDMLDEIRLAILDDTPIGDFIYTCGDDYYKLSQLRKAIRELIPIEYLRTCFSGTVIKNIRIGISKGYDMSELLRYANDKCISLDLSSFETISDFLAIGVDLSSIDFTKVPKSQVTLYCKGLFNNYPMWLLISDDKPLSDERIKLLMRGMDLGIDIHPFLDDRWLDDVIVYLFSKSKFIDINRLLGLISPMFTKNYLEFICNLAKDKLPYDVLCVKDEDGYPVYNIYQFSVLNTAIREGILEDRMLNPNISDSEMWLMVEEVLDMRKRKLNVSLNKKY